MELVPQPLSELLRRIVVEKQRYDAIYDLPARSFWTGSRLDLGVSFHGAPAIVGDEHFERSYRVQMNTLELLVAFIPGLYVAARYWPETFVALLGVVYLIGRFLFARAYVADPRRRGPGFLVSMLPIGVLVISALVGALLGRGAG